MRLRTWPLLVLALMVGCSGKTNSDQAEVSKNAKTLAGGGASGADDGLLAGATFHNPVNVAVDLDGTIYVADFDNNRIRKISTAGAVSTLVNTPTFQRPFGLAISKTGILYAQTDADDTGAAGALNGTVWRIDKVSGVPTKIAGPLGRPRGLAVLSGGDLIISDVNRHTVRRLNPTTGVVTDIAGQADSAGFADGTGAAVRFNRPYGVAVLADDSIIVADQNNHRIRKVTLAGVVTTVAGQTAPGATNGRVEEARFNGPQDVSVDLDGRIYVADTGNHQLRVIQGNFVILVAGSGVRGFKDGVGPDAQFWGLEGIDVDKVGRIVVADGTGGDDTDPPYNRVRIVNP